MTDRVGQQLGNYRLTRLLGKGGFADVYLGEHVYLKTFAAIKLLQMRLVNEDLQNFLAEARTIASLDHPHIVRVLDFGVEGNVPFLVMSYAPNGTVRDLHPKGSRVPPALVVSYVQQVADALQYAHDRKLIHRDVKPENMLLGSKREVLLSDFGIALASQSSRYESTKEVVGTSAYMAPEQLQGKPRPATDQYALGIIVYEWLSGDRPFHGTFYEMYSQHMFVPPPPLHEKVPAIPPAVEQVILTALAKDPQQRFPSIEAFATALEQSCKGTTLHQVTGLNTSTMPTQLMPIAFATAPERTPLPSFAPTLVGQTPIPPFAAMPPGQTPTPLFAATPPGQTPIPPFAPTLQAEQSQKVITRRKAIVALAGVGVAGVAASSFALLANLKGSPSSPLATATTVNASGTAGHQATVTKGKTPGHSATATPGGTSKPGATSTSGVTSGSDPTPDPTSTTSSTNSGKWTPTGSLLLARSRFRATTLQTGDVLIEGGVLPSSYTAESEVFNPATGTWFVTGSLNQARGGHTATLLSNGIVLVTGGLAGPTLASAELYDRIKGTWTLTGNMTQPRTRHTATLVNGLVLVCGGWNNGNITSSSEIFNPATGTWSLATSMAATRVDHSAVLLPNGNVLVAGGSRFNGDYTSEAELYNLSSNTWTVTGSMNVPRLDFTLVLLSNGKVLALGGTTPNGQTATAELYNPATGSWSLTGSMHNPRSGLRDQNAVLLADGTVLIACGDAGLGTSEVYNPATGTWSSPINMTETHYDGATAYLGGGRVLAVGGYDGSNNKVAGAEIYG